MLPSFFSFVMIGADQGHAFMIGEDQTRSGPAHVILRVKTSLLRHTPSRDAILVTSVCCGGHKIYL